MSASRILRDRTAFLSDALDRSGNPGPAANGAVVGITTAIKTYPTTAGVFYGIIPQVITGTSAEGDAGTFASDLAAPDDPDAPPTAMVALNVGTAVPPAGTKVVCDGVGGRWVFRYDG
jgi:hypothetical protein